MTFRELLRDAASPGDQLHPRDARWRPYFLLSLASFAVSVVIFLALVTSAACGSGDDNGSQTPLETKGAPTNTATNTEQPATNTSTATATATAPPATTTPVASANGGGGDGATVPPDNSIVLPCNGDVLAPLDKQHVLPADCVPPDLVTLPGNMQQGGQRMRAAAAIAFEQLVAAAQKDGFTLVSVSAYRSYQDQVAAFNSNVAAGGLEYALRTSARPGHSEHMLGTTTDVSSADAGFGLESFAGTPEAQWLADNCWKYGFVISYPDGKESVTGYAYEPWHIRWVGNDAAAQVHRSGRTLHEYITP